MPLRLKSLSTELTIVFASIVVVLVGFLSYFSLELVSQSHEETLRRDIQNTVDQAVLIIDKELDERIREVESVTLSPTLKDAVVDLSEEHAALAPEKRTEAALLKRFKGHACGGERPEITRLLRAVQEAHPYISEFLLTDKFGITIGCTSQPERLEFSEETWWQEAVTRGLSLSNLVPDPRTNTFVYSVALPVYDGAVTTTGVLRAVFNLRAMQDALRAMRIGEHGFLVAMGRQGRIFAHPEQRYLWKKAGDVPELAYLSRVVGSGAPRGVLIYQPTPEDEESGESGAGVQPAQAGTAASGPASVSPARQHSLFDQPLSLASASEESWILAYSRTLRPASLGPLGWTVVGTVSRAEVISPITAIRERVTWVAGSLILAAIAIVWFVSRRLARPLNDLALRADLIAAGDLSVNLRVPSRNEIARLASALSSMVDSLRESNISLAKSNTNLEKIVADRTRQLEEKSKLLEKQSRDVLEASRLKSQFLANMSHELRTPLNAVLALSEILAERISGDLNDEQVKQVTLINRSGRNLLRLINDILDLSKIEAGRLEVYLSVFELRATISAVKDTIAPLAAEKKLDFEVVLDPALPACVKSDDAKIRQVLVNLLGNAVKFTHSGGVTLTLSRRDRPLPGSDEPPPPMSDQGPFWLEFKVSDTGIGIPHDAIEKIFDEFQQADGSATRKYGGSGLGLAISKRLTELMGGEISAESEEGKGSAFRVLLPVEGVVSNEQTVSTSIIRPETSHSRIAAREAQPPAAPAMARAARGTDPGVRRAEQPPASGKRKWVTPLREHPIPISPRFLDIRDDTHNLLPHIPTLLVVDDDPESLYVYRQFLSRSGYQVIFAINGEQVVEKARQFSPVAIILDLMLPHKSGWEVLEELKITEDLKNIPVIIASVLDHRERGVCAGAFRYLTKPMSERQLSGVLAELEKARKKDVRRVLVIDDDPVEIGIAKTLFAKAGLDVVAMQDGAAAVDWAAAEHPDFIVLDLMMPVMDGFEVLSRLKANPATAKIPVLVYTAKEVSEEEKKRLLPAAQRIFPKMPLQIEEMLDELQRALQTVPMPGQASAASSVRAKAADERPPSMPDEPVAEPSNIADTAPLRVEASASRRGASSAAEESFDAAGFEPGSGRAAEQETVRPAGPGAGEAFRARVLLVEDDPANQYSISFLLRSNGYEVLLAENGEQGLERAEKDRPDLILMDMMMPVMSGFDATRHLKSKPNLRDIPVIALTAAAMRGDRERTLEAGCDDYVSKPVDRNLLLQRIEHWLAAVPAAVGPRDGGRS